ncbi:hypothetical protein [Mycobacterium canetti]|uniref:hypothetical protein n=1 Tax=Mycobacterium canetti TaxID=78331 RepID=UPI00034743AF|nr:hypothetical protein [Mycobacterium canetti]
MTGPDDFSEFAVYVRDIGAVQQRDPVTFTVGDDEPSIFADSDTAFLVADRVAGEYRRLGVSEVADKVHVVARDVCTMRGPWRAPITGSADYS